MDCMPKSPANRRYIRRLIPTTVAYLVILLCVTWYVHHFHPAGLIAYVLAVLPALPILGMIAVIGLYLAEEQDEFLRVLLTQSMLWGIGLTLATTTVWGFLELFASVSPFQPYLTFPLFWFFVGATTPILKRRYR